MAEAFIVRRGGGGGSGGTLVVTSSGAGTVTVSNSTLGKSYSKTVTAGGSVTFKALKTGTWNVTLSDGTQTVTKTVTINADYSTSIAYFSATINITYPATSTCVVTNSSGETVASDTNTGSSTKTWTATVNATGTYTVTATATDGSGKSKSQSVSITSDGQSESVTLAYELVLIDNGSLHTDITGEWEIDEYEVWASSETPPSMTNEIDHISIYTGVGRDVAISHSTAIDVTNCKTLSIKVSAYQTRGTTVKVGLSTSKTGSDLAVSSGDLTTDNKTRTITLDVSSVSGNVYFKAVSGEQMNIKIYDLRIV